MSRLVRLAIPLLALLWTLWLAGGASGFVMMDQGDYGRTVQRLIAEPVEPLALPHSMPVSQRWRLQPISDWKLRLYRGSATPMIAAAALPAALIQRPFDTRHMAIGGSLLVALGMFLCAWRLADRQAVPTAAVAAAVTLPLVLAAHNAALLGSFYAELALVVALPFVVLALLMPAGGRSHGLLFVATAVAAMAKAPFFYLPLLVAVGLWLSDRIARKRSILPVLPRRRGAWAALAAAQLLAVIVLVRGEYAAINAHHATFLGSDYGLDAEGLTRAGLPSHLHHCVGVDYWGNRVPTPSAVRIEPRPAGCEDLPTRTFGQALGTYLQDPGRFMALATASLPVHTRADYFHLKPEAPYRHRVDEGRAARLLEAVSRGRDVPLHGMGYPLLSLALLLALLTPWAWRLGAAWAPLVVLAAFASSQVVVSLLGEGVRDLGKHLAAGQYALDLALALLIALGVLRILRNAMPHGLTRTD